MCLKASTLSCARSTGRDKCARFLPKALTKTATRTLRQNRRHLSGNGGELTMPAGDNHLPFGKVEALAEAAKLALVALTRPRVRKEKKKRAFRQAQNR